MTEQAEATTGRSRLKRVIIDVVLIAACLGIMWAVCAHHIQHGALGEGDNGEWRDEAHERSTWQSVFDYRYYSGRHGPSAYYNPVQMLIWQALLALFDYHTEVRPYLAFLLIVHSLNIIIFYLLGRELIGKSAPVFLAATCFAVFFPNWHTAGWAAAMITTGVSGFFIFVALYLLIIYFRARKKYLLALSAASYFLALFTKEFAVFAIPIFVIYYLTTQRARTIKPLQSDLVFLPYCLVTIPMALIVLSRLGGSAITNEWGGFNFGVHMVFRFFDYLIYLVTAVPAIDFIKFSLACGFIVAIPLLIWASLKDKVIAFLVLWLVIAVLVYSFSNFRDLVTLQRYLYQPSVPWFLLLFYLVSRPRKWISIPLTIGLSASIIGYNIYRIFEST